MRDGCARASDGDPHVCRDSGSTEVRRLDLEPAVAVVQEFRPMV